MGGARPQVALGASAARGLCAAVRDDLRHRGMLVGKPVRRVERIVDLRLGVFLGAARRLLLTHAVERLGLGRDRIGPVHGVTGGSILGNRHRGPQRNEQHPDRSPHGNASRMRVTPSAAEAAR